MKILAIFILYYGLTLNFSLIRFSSAQSICFDLIHQYYQCKTLKMIARRDRFGPLYVPDRNVTNNTLNDEFYQTLGLQKKTFDEAIDLIKSIYVETKNNTELFKCVGSRLIDNYALMFLNETITNQSKPIITSFANRFRPNLLPFRILQQMFAKGQNLTTLVQFCINYDYTYRRTSYYNNTQTCYKEPDYLVRYIKSWIPDSYINK